MVSHFQHVRLYAVQFAFFQQVFFLRLGRVTGEEKAGVPAGEIGTDGIVVQRTVVLGGRRYDLQRSRSHVNGHGGGRCQDQSVGFDAVQKLFVCTGGRHHAVRQLGAHGVADRQVTVLCCVV